MKIKSNHIFLYSFKLPFSVSLKGLIVSMLCIIGFDDVLGGVAGIVYGVVFGVLSTLVNFTLDAMVFMTTFGNN